MNLLFTIDFGQEKFDLLRSEGHTVNFVDEFAPARQLTSEERACDILICYNPFPKYPLSLFPDLKYIQLESVGFNHIPIEDIRARKLPVYHNFGKTKKPIAEWVMYLLLNICKQGKTHLKQQQDHTWHILRNRIWELEGKQVTFLGAGNIAQETARKLKAFDAVTVALILSDDPAPYIDRVYTMDHMNEVLQNTDVLISCLPATKETYHLLNHETLSLLRDDSVLINISRGSVVDEEALCSLLRQGKFRGVGLDVFETEPLPQSSPLWDFDNVYVTPHSAIESDLCYERVFDMIHTNINRFVQGEEPLYPVHYDRGY